MSAPRPPSTDAPRRTFAAQVTITILLLVAAALAAFALTSRESPTGPQQSNDDRTDSWSLPVDPRPLVEKAGLDLGPMGTADHYHPQLRILVDGAPVEVPAGIGIEPMTGAMSALHTHTPDGELHVEADRKGQRFTLGQLFTQWDVPISPSQIGEVEGEVEVTVNSEPFAGDPADLKLDPDQVIELSVQR